MPRKLVKRAPSEASSGLSSAPEDVAESVQITVKKTTKVDDKPKAASRKRKLAEVIEKPSEAVSVIVKAETQLNETSTTPTKRKRVKRDQVKNEPEDDDAASLPQPPKTSRRKVAAKTKTKPDPDDDSDEPAPKPAKRTKPKPGATSEVTPTQSNGPVAEEKKVVRKRKTKEEREAEAMPLAPRTISHKIVIGAHVSSAGGVPNSVTNALYIGANAFALFLKSQRKWTNPPLDPSQASAFHANCKSHSYAQHAHVVPHGSYLVNLAHTDPDRTKQAYDAFTDDLRRCESLGITLYNFHPGNSVGGDRQTAIAHLASNLNRAHAETSTVVTLLENMAAGGNVLGSTFEDLRDVIALVTDKARVGVCLDTCHAFAGGYDLRDRNALEATLSHFDDVVGIKYLRALHLNDSKAPFRSHRDLHANIGTGFLGLRAFHAVVNEVRFQGLPMVLETPIEVRDEQGNLVKDDKGKEKEDKGIWAREIKMLESLVGMDVESDEFKEMGKRLQKMGTGERSRVADQVERREEKQKAVKEKKEKGRAKKKTKQEDTDGSALSELDSDNGS